MSRYAIFLIFLLPFVLLSGLHAQGHEDVFPDKSGSELLNLLKANFKPSTVLTYQEARILMYTEIDNHEDSVRGVYTKYALPLSPDDPNPIGTLIRNGSSSGINTEHTFPQSKGARSGNARSDMHHLFPAKAGVNEARSNFPFGEIEDRRTQRWFYKAFIRQSIPTKRIDEYSESVYGLFEPREDHKGNVARAMFYFYTMYRDQADGPFFGEQRATLCDWFYQDPVDEAEWLRNNMIAQYQNNKKNPFILDCTLAQRTYCPDHQEVCLTSTKQVENNEKITLFPNPSAGMVHIEIEEFNANHFQLQVNDMLGRKILDKRYDYSDSNNQISLDIPEAGFYSLHLNWSDSDGNIHRIVRKFIIQ